MFAKSWSDLCNFYSKVIFFEFVFKKIFFTFFAETELLIFHNNTVKIIRKIEEVDLVENLAPNYLS